MTKEIQKIRRLRNALYPLSSFIPRCFHDLEDDVIVYKNGGSTITAGDFREAHAALLATFKLEVGVQALLNAIPDAPDGFAYQCERCGQTMNHPSEAEGCRDPRCPAHELG